LEKIRNEDVIFSEEPTEIITNSNLWIQDSVHMKMYSAELFFPFSKSTFFLLLNTLNIDFLDALTDTCIGIETMLELVKKFGYNENAYQVLKKITNTELFSFWSMFYFMGISDKEPEFIKENNEIIERIFIYIAMFQGNAKKYNGWFKKSSIIDYLRFIPDKKMVTRLVVSIHILDSMFTEDPIKSVNISPVWYWDSYVLVNNFVQEFKDRCAFLTPTRTFRECIPNIGKKLFYPTKPKSCEEKEMVLYNDFTRGIGFFEKFYSPFPLEKVDEYYFQYEFPSHYVNEEYIYNELEFNGGKFFNDHKHITISKLPERSHLTNYLKLNTSLTRKGSYRNLFGKYTLYKNPEDVFIRYDFYYYTIDHIPWNLLSKENLKPRHQYLYSNNLKSIFSGIVV
jgi:hypothetical protein